MTDELALKIFEGGHPWVRLMCSCHEGCVAKLDKRIGHKWAAYVDGRRDRLVIVDPRSMEAMTADSHAEPRLVAMTPPTPRPFLPDDPIIEPDAGALRYLLCPVPGGTAGPAADADAPPDSRWFATDRRGYGTVSVVNVAYVVRADEPAPDPEEGKPHKWNVGDIVTLNEWDGDDRKARLVERLNVVPTHWRVLVAPDLPGEFYTSIAEYRLRPAPPAPTIADLADAWLANPDHNTTRVFCDALRAAKHDNDDGDPAFVHHGRSFRAIGYGIEFWCWPPEQRRPVK